MSNLTFLARVQNNVKWAEFSTNYFVEHRVASGNSYKKRIIRLVMVMFNFELSDYATIISKLSLHSICSIHGQSIINLPLNLNHLT